MLDAGIGQARPLQFLAELLDRMPCLLLAAEPCPPVFDQPLEDALALAGHNLVEEKEDAAAISE